MSSSFAHGCLVWTEPGRTLLAHEHYRDLFERARGHRVEACWLCGERCPASIPVGDQITESFTNHGVSRAPKSARICVRCVFFLMAHPSSRHWWRNRSSLFSPLVPGGVRHPRRSEWRDILLDPPEPPFMCCLAVSGQKNLIFRAPVAESRVVFPVQFEEEVVVLDVASLRTLVEPVEELLAAGLIREEILLGRVRSSKVLRLGVDRWRALDAAIAPRRHSMLLRLVVWIARRDDSGGERG